MFWFIFLLLTAGLILILLESVVPHGISAIVGVLVVGFSVFMAFQQGWEPRLTALYLVFAATLAALAAWLALRSGIRLLSLGPARGATPGAEAAGIEPVGIPGGTGPALGETVRVVQPLRPTGSVQWNGQRLAARTLRPEAESAVGESAVVRGRDSIYLLVEPLPPSQGTGRAAPVVPPPADPGEGPAT